MRLQPNRNYISNDDVQTPPELARRLVEHFKPRGRVLEPCAGEGHFLRALRRHRAIDRVTWCEIKHGRDFLAGRVDWIVTNPPWSQIRTFLQHAMRVADEVVFLLTVNHVWTKARVADIRDSGFGVRQIVLLDMPDSFPQRLSTRRRARLARLDRPRDVDRLEYAEEWKERRPGRRGRIGRRGRLGRPGRRRAGRAEERKTEA